MDVELIAATRERRELLAPMLTALGGIEVKARLRTDSPSWHSQGNPQASDVLILDSPQSDQAQDLAVLGQWLTRYPSMGVLMLTDNVDPTFLLQAMRLGIREVLGLHPSKSDLLEAVNRLKRQVLAFKAQVEGSTSTAHHPGKVMAFLSCKGGSGSTFLAANVAHLMVNEFQHDTVFIDLDLHHADGTYYLANDTHKNSITDLTGHIDRLDAHLLHSSLHPVVPGLFLLAAPAMSESTADVSPSQLEKIIDLARHQYDTLIMDLNPTLSAVEVKALDCADLVYVVMENTVPHVRNAKRLVTLLRSLGYPDSKLRVIVNKYHPISDIDVVNIESTIGLKVSRSIPIETTAVVQAVNQGVPLATLQAHNPVVRSLRELIAEELHLPVAKRKNWLERWF